MLHRGQPSTRSRGSSEIKPLLGANRDENQVFKILELRPQPATAQLTALRHKLNSIEKLTALLLGLAAEQAGLPAAPEDVRLP